MVQDSRRTEYALRWAEELIGGTIVRRELQPRWRPMWALDIRKASGTVIPLLLRGFRNPVGPDEQSFRERLKLEAELLEALQNTGVHLSKYYGYEPSGGWFLMERLCGDYLLSKVNDVALQADLMRQYMADIARLHQLDVDSVPLPQTLHRPESHEDACRMMLREFRAPYDAWPAKEPEPLFALCDWWLSEHMPQAVSRFSVCSGDVGADQFMFEDGQYKGMFDIEMARIGDPMQDIGGMRTRDLCYPIPDLPDYIEHWSVLMNRALDKESVCYWTIASAYSIPMITYPLWVSPAVELVSDTTLMHACIPLYRRASAEALAEYYGFELERIDYPSSKRALRYHDWLHAQLCQHYAPQFTGREGFEFACTAALAETACLEATLGPRLEQDNVADLAEVLGKRPPNSHAGLVELEERIREDPERDLETVVRVLHLIESRRELVLSPIQAVCGIASQARLQKMF